MRAMISAISLWDLAWFERFFGMSDRTVWGRVLRGASRSADGFMYPVVFLVLLTQAPEAGGPLFVAGLVAFALELTLYKFIKARARRPRPFAALSWVSRRMDVPDEFSFPSGHTAAAFVMATLLCSWQPVLLPLLGVWASLVGVSRVHLGVHYPTDVLAGMVLGMGSAGLGLLVAAAI